MAIAEKNFIPVTVVKKRGRKPSLKAVGEAVEKATKKAGKTFLGIWLSEKNSAYFKAVAEKSGQSQSYLINLLVDGARAKDLLADVPNKEPMRIIKAREALAEWEKSARKK